MAFFGSGMIQNGIRLFIFVLFLLKIGFYMNIWLTLRFFRKPCALQFIYLTHAEPSRVFNPVPKGIIIASSRHCLLLCKESISRKESLQNVDNDQIMMLWHLLMPFFLFDSKLASASRFVLYRMAPQT